MCAPNWLPSPSAFSICAPRWAWLITSSHMPACTRFSMCQTISGLPPASSNGLGVWSVSGRMRSPRPAARIMAIMVLRLSRLPFPPRGGESWIGGDAQHRSKCVALSSDMRFQRVEQIQQRLKVDVPCASSAQICHDQRQVLQVAFLAVAVIQAREDAQYLEMALHGHPFIIAVENGKILMHRQTNLARFFPIAYQPVDDFSFLPVNV